MAGGESQRMNDGLRKLLGDIGMLMATPDADQQFLSKLQQAIYTRMGQPSPQGQPGGQAPGAPGQPPQGPGMPPGPPRPMPGGGVGGQGGFGGAGMGNAMPNPDELRRILQGGAQG
jgi:hypothetical protein